MNDLFTILHRSVVRSTADAGRLNKRVLFKSDVQESIKLIDIPNQVLIWKD
jgi:hypothetical protein